MNRKFDPLAGTSTPLVFPARAGMNRTVSASSRSSRRLCLVFPARAGMNRNQPLAVLVRSPRAGMTTDYRFGPRRGFSVPRAGGDEPAWRVIELSPQCSPRGRG